MFIPIDVFYGKNIKLKKKNRGLLSPSVNPCIDFGFHFFNESGIDLRLGFWVKDPENGFLGLFSAILLDIWQRFKEEGIDFPYPQREVRILNEESTSNTAAIQQAAQQAQRNTRSSEEAGADE